MIPIAALGTVAALHGALKERMGEVAAQFWQLETETSGTARAPKVIDGWLPPRENTPGEQFPFMLVRPKSGIDTPQSSDENATAIFQIIVGTFSDTDDGWLDLVLVIDAIRDSLGAKPLLNHTAELGAGDVTVRTAFEHVGPLTWEIPDDQARPQWLATINTVWMLPRPQRQEQDDPNEE